ncbi:hypothetical protein NEHOM01_1271 [Nematocida homosporus]|uniref:uncharacterized protein n=1 Tax=Nematocida homosporus TaxID=1912981 RepID=UPI0022207D09|nr:uncharacterized protein NEHOM01_1271 [Nematocida homosporus]KAI5186089.1 hypothetical protein NEHOM01_1271 [Nematocida homosporus]
MDIDIRKSMNHYAELTDNKKSRIEHRKVAREALELKTMPIEERTPSDIEKKAELRDILVLCTAEKISIPKLFSFLKERGTYKEVNIYFRECIHIIIDQPDQKSGDVFIFKYGVTVFWGIDKETTESILSQQQFFEEKSYPRELMEREDFKYGIVADCASIANDIIYLDNESIYNKMIISNAMSQSAKLDVFERYVERTAERIKGLPDEIVSKGFTTRKRGDIVKMKGLLHRLKFNLNLVTNILDTPEILWCYPNYTSLYETFKLYLELKSRAEILNHKCDVIHEILNLLSTHINTKYGERLEKIIIFLICIETVVSFVHLALSWSRSS